MRILSTNLIKIDQYTRQNIPIRLLVKAGIRPSENTISIIKINTLFRNLFVIPYKQINELLKNQRPEAEKGRSCEGTADIAGPKRAIFGNGCLAVGDCSNFGDVSALRGGGDGCTVGKDIAFSQCQYTIAPGIAYENDDVVCRV